MTRSLVSLVPPLAAALAVCSGPASFAAAGSCTVTPSPTWSTSIDFPSTPFAVPGAGGDLPAWVKFTILTCDPGTVYFQNSNVYAFHYEFATAQLDPFLGLSPAQFDQISLFETGQQAILGAVLLPGWDPSSPPPGGFPQEFGIQLIRQDAYAPAEVVNIFHTVRAAVTGGPGVQAYYFPTFEQAAVAQKHGEFLATNGVVVSSAARWAVSNPIYSDGWTIGTLKFFTGAAIEDAYTAGLLGPGDVLLTDDVPAEVPFVAGIIALEPATPNAHVAILASTFGIPFVHLAQQADADAAESMIGDRVILRAYAGPLGNDVALINVEGVLDEATIDMLLALKAPPELDITPMATFGAISAPVASLELSDVQHFGGKASNYSLLLQSIPHNARVATALSFDLWNGFLDQTLPWGITLRQEIDDRLSGYTWPPPDLEALADDLDDIRDMIDDEEITAFTPAQETAIIATLLDAQYGFDPMKGIRFRSSTNVEDGEHFSGAGLYESKTGCLADELDGDDIGPSQCDPDEEDEDGVFKSIRGVFESFYNDNAFLERLRHDVDESEVGMAILVHHSFPDPTELANGVAILHTELPQQQSILMVTQNGAIAVTNPEIPGTIPEEVELTRLFSPWQADVLRHSNLVLLGETVMEFDAEYVEFADLFATVATAWEQASGTTSDYLLDFEYKKITPGDQLVVKQVRQVPRPDDVPSMLPFLVNQPVEYELFQGEFGDIAANHRLKARLRLETRNMWMTAENLQESIYSAADFETVGACGLRQLAGDLPSFPEASYALVGNQAFDSWAMTDLPNPRTYVLHTPDVQFFVPPSQPLIIQTDLGFDASRQIDVTYQDPVPTFVVFGPKMVTSEYAALIPRQMPHPDDQLQVRSYDGPGGITIETRFFWPPPPSGIVAGYTAPCKRFLETTITGLTIEPIVLRGYYSQTCRPEHHNFGDNFIFDPWLDPEVAHAQLEELEQQNVRAILVTEMQFKMPEVSLLSNEEIGLDCPPHCAADIDRDGTIDIDDLVAVILAWGTADAAADADSDGIVGVNDLVTVILSWGPCV